MAIDPITGGEALLTSLTSIVGKFIPDPAAKAAAESELRDSLQKWDAGQTAVDVAEAVNPDLFVSGWRPFIGWVGGAALCWQYVAAPIVMWIGFIIGHPLPAPPMFDSSIYGLVFALLGLGGFRTYEKVKGIA